MSARLITGDCRAIMPTLLEGQFASIVTDPPYEIGFMGKRWDGTGVAFQSATWEKMLPVVRAGGYLLAFGGTRSYHRMACAIEDAGWEIVDSLTWLYGQGFPKHNSKLKPAFEPIVMARAPGPVHALAIDECRISVTDDAYARNASGDRGHSGTREHGEVTDIRAGGGSAHDGGRWPANVCLDETAAKMLDAQSGIRKSGANPIRRGSDKFRDVYGEFVGQVECEPARGADAGGASRFFYCPKATRSERNAGLDGLPDRDVNHIGQRKNNGSGGLLNGTGFPTPTKNHHPTVKPIELMRWLVRLVTPRGGDVLDPFMGSGSTGAACSLEGFGFVGTDLTPEYVEIARRRIVHWRKDDLFAVEVG